MRKGKGADIFRSDRFFDEGGCGGFDVTGGKQLQHKWF